MLNKEKKKKQLESLAKNFKDNTRMLVVHLQKPLNLKYFIIKVYTLIEILA